MFTQESQKYYAQLDARLLGNQFPESEKVTDDSLCAVFNFLREYDRTAPWLCYDFLNDLYRLFGQPVLPTTIIPTPFALETALAYEQGWDGRSFIDRVMNDPEFHDVFKRYGITDISLGNSNGAKLKTNSSGRPVPLFQ